MTDDREEYMAHCQGCQKYTACKRWRNAIDVCKRCWRKRRSL